MALVGVVVLLLPLPGPGELGCALSFQDTSRIASKSRTAAQLPDWGLTDNESVTHGGLHHTAAFSLSGSA